MQKSLKLMIVEDHTCLRQGLKSLLKDFNFQIIYEAANGKQALDLLKEVQPDIILLDIEMPVMNGLETLQIIKQKYHSIKVIILTGHSNHSLFTEVLKSGADGYLLKNCNIEDLVSTILSLNEKTPIIYQTSQAIEVHYDNTYIELLIGQRSLTGKEVDVLIMLCNGKSRKEIAQRFNITVRTITFHTDNIYKKTKLSNKEELYKYAVKNGYISII